MFDSVIDRLNEDFQFNKSSDFLQVELIGIYLVKLVRAQIEANVTAAESFDRMIRSHMKDLKATKIVREGEEPKGDRMSPAEWASALLEKVSEASLRKAELEKKKKLKKSSDNTRSASKKSPKA